MTFCLLSTHSLYSCRENRYLLFLTENYAALEILRHYLNDVVHSSPLDSVATGSEDGGERSLEKMEPFILFGSSFPRDKEYTQVCVCGCGGGGVGESSSLVFFHDDVISCMCNVMVGRSNWRVDGTTAKVL